jgi:GNAT superfamily N-acetyltransferase
MMNLIITDFTHSHTEEALNLAKLNYKIEQSCVPLLPSAPTWPDLTRFADNGLGVAAFESGKMIGFLCCVPPFDNAFRSTNVKGVFSPMEANGTIAENRDRIYAAMYQHAAQKWVDTGAVSHGICLYAHNETAQQQFFRYGFGLRCIDAIRSMEQIDCKSCDNYVFVELKQSEFVSIFPLDLMLNEHMRKSPTFMCRQADTSESFANSCAQEKARYFVAKQSGNLCAFLKITDTGETFITEMSDTQHINGAFCLPEHRGKDVYQSLLNYTISTLKAEGYTRLGVDFESINPAAYGFWLKYFTAYTHSVVRRIDELIIENKNKL